MDNGITKEEWISLFREIGLNDAAMNRWHQLFEQRHPQGHEAFLRWLGLEEGDVQKIRQNCCAG